MNGDLMHLRFNTLFLESILRFENKVVLFDHRTDQPTAHALLSVSFLRIVQRGYKKTCRSA